MILARRIASLLAAVLAVQCGGDSLRESRSDLGHADPEKRVAALRRLGEAGDRESVPVIIQMLADADSSVRIHAARALGNIGDARAAVPLARFCEREGSPAMVGTGFRALKRLGRSAAEPLVAMLDSRRVDLRAGAAGVLGELRIEAAVDGLMWRLDDVSPDVRKAAIKALRQIGDARGLEAIARRVGDSDDEVQGAAEDALGGRGYQDDLDRAKRLIRRVPGR